MSTSRKSLYTVRIFPKDETTQIVYEKVTHVFSGSTVLVLCLPDGKHAHWLREWIRHYDVTEEPNTGRLEA
jgi:hypothetical protein